MIKKNNSITYGVLVMDLRLKLKMIFAVYCTKNPWKYNNFHLSQANCNFKVNRWVLSNNLKINIWEKTTKNKSYLIPIWNKNHVINCKKNTDRNIYFKNMNIRKFLLNLLCQKFSYLFPDRWWFSKEFIWLVRDTKHSF